MSCQTRRHRRPTVGVSRTDTIKYTDDLYERSSEVVAEWNHRCWKKIRHGYKHRYIQSDEYMEKRLFANNMEDER